MWSLKSASAAKVVMIVVVTVVIVATAVVVTTAGMVTVATVVVTATVATVRSANHATRTTMNLQNSLHHSHRPMMLIWHCNSNRNIYLQHPAPKGGMFFKIPFRFLIRHLQKSA